MFIYKKEFYYYYYEFIFYVFLILFMGGCYCLWAKIAITNKNLKKKIFYNSFYLYNKFLK